MCIRLFFFAEDTILVVYLGWILLQPTMRIPFPAPVFAWFLCRLVFFFLLLLTCWVANLVFFFPREARALPAGPTSTATGVAQPAARSTSRGRAALAAASVHCTARNDRRRSSSASRVRPVTFRARHPRPWRPRLRPPPPPSRPRSSLSRGRPPWRQ